MGAFEEMCVGVTGQDIGHHPSPKFIIRMAQNATPWYTILDGALYNAMVVGSTLYYRPDIYPKQITTKAEEYITTPTAKC